MKNLKLHIAKTITKILNPLVRILLRHEISHSEFSEIAKRSYVDVAYTHFSIPNRKKTYARVAVLTGLNLKEVRRISNAAEDDMLMTKGPINRAKQVISGWTRDSDFLDENNKPKILPLRDKNNSFATLVGKYSGDITPRAILDELLRVGAVEKINNDSVKLVQTALIPSKSEQDMIDIIAQHNGDLMNTGIFNLTNKDNDLRFQRQVTYVDMPNHVVEQFRLYSREKSMELLVDFDRWLAEHSNNEKTTETQTSKGRVGVGIYFFNSENEGDKS